MLAFYRDVLGLDVTLEAGDFYYELRMEGVILALYDRGLMGQMVGSELGPRPPRSDAVALTFQVDDVDQAFERLRERGAQFVTDPMDYEVAFLRMAHLRDPEGNLIEINAPLATIP